MSASNVFLVPLVPVPVLDNVQHLAGDGTPRSAYIYSGDGAVVNMEAA